MNNEQKTPEKRQDEQQKSPLIKTLAVIAFLIIIVVCAWAAVRLAMLLPSAFSSLASIADIVYNFDDEAEDIELTLSSETTDVDSGITLDWAELRRDDGQYAFRYDCIEGVAADIRVNNSQYAVDCDEYFFLPDGTTTVEVLFTSEKMSTAYVPVTIAFVPDNDNADVIESSSVIAVNNPDIPTRVVDNGDETDTETEPEPEQEPEPEPSTPAKPAPQPTKTVAHVRYELPQSDPNGDIDLAVAFIDAGEVNSAGNYTPRARLNEDDDGAFRFSVKNIGTKTSKSWYFEGETTTGTEFESKTYTGLKPNEEAIIVVAFPNTGHDGDREVTVTVHTDDDENDNNNDFEAEIEVD